MEEATSYGTKKGKNTEPVNDSSENREVSDSEDCSEEDEEENENMIAVHRVEISEDELINIKEQLGEVVCAEMNIANLAVREITSIAKRN
ncbi:34601_t:CDS:2, partial [Racocetra persica]